MDLERVLGILQEDSLTTKKRLQDVSDYLDLAIQHHRNPCPTTGSGERVRLAARAYREAVGEFVRAEKRLSRFVNEGIVPEDFATPSGSKGPIFSSLVQEISLAWLPITHRTARIEHHRIPAQRQRWKFHAWSRARGEESRENTRGLPS